MLEGGHADVGDVVSDDLDKVPVSQVFPYLIFILPQPVTRNAFNSRLYASICLGAV